jgi:hypothetical protein
MGVRVPKKRLLAVCGLALQVENAPQINFTSQVQVPKSHRAIWHMNALTSVLVRTKKKSLFPGL